MAKRNTGNSGSPPRVRGKRSDCGGAPVRQRITPARAGKTCSRQAGCCHRKDHPRACGENGTCIPGWTSCIGSPPRVRGKRHHRDRQREICGITPARAGKTFKPEGQGNNEWDHPRACGENETAQAETRGRAGSPPRVRGKQKRQAGENQPHGITPARAGKTYRRKRAGAERQDHPRACGENMPVEGGSVEYKGSPPRVRGKLADKCSRLRDHGITPARAGKTLHSRRYPPPGRDHPRACGENQLGG